MFENTLELAENKLLLLYTLNMIKFPISNNQITQIILENNFINYFTLQQYLLELSSSDLVKYIEDNGKNRIAITDQGKRVLDFFANRISKDKLEVINNYLKNNMENIRKEVAITADYTIDENNNFIVNLKALENKTILLDLKVSVGSNKQAQELCNRWKNDSSSIYNKIMDILTKD